jgi:inosine-uridine nucleoside N-ribohydrolase
MADERTKILFDTDPGIDDALALLMLARDARAELVGVSTVFGNAAVEATCANALALCERFGIDAPVARGAARPLQRVPRDFPVAVHGRDGLGDIGWPRAGRRNPDPRPAPEFIGALARQHRGELVIVAVGPLTNLALALQADPGLPARVREVVVMAGAFGTGGRCGNATPLADANVYSDPHAAAMVFAAGWPLTVVGLDVTEQVVMRSAYLDGLAANGGDDGRFVRELTRGYAAFHGAGIDGLYAHDATAVAYTLDAARFGTRCGVVTVATEGAMLGHTTLSAMPARRGAAVVQACVAVDAQAVLADFRACVVAAAGQG